jgi:hypothetical protein
MIVEVRTDGSVVLAEPEDTRGFKVVAPLGMTEGDIARALVGVADLQADHAWVYPSSIRRMSPLASRTEWQTSFAKMLDYARSKNWLRATDDAIRAHIEHK